MVKPTVAELISKIWREGNRAPQAEGDETVAFIPHDPRPDNTRTRNEIAARIYAAMMNLPDQASLGYCLKKMAEGNCDWKEDESKLAKLAVFRADCLIRALEGK